MVSQLNRTSGSTQVAQTYEKIWKVKTHNRLLNRVFSEVCSVITSEFSL